MCAKSLQSCPPLWDPMNSSPPGSSVHGILRQEHWSGLSCPPPGDLPDPGIKPLTLTYPALVVGFFIPVAPSGKSKAISYYCQLKNNKVFIYLFMLFLADLHCFMGFSLVAESEGCLSSCGE